MGLHCLAHVVSVAVHATTHAVGAAGTWAWNHKGEIAIQAGFILLDVATDGMATPFIAGAEEGLIAGEAAAGVAELAAEGLAEEGTEGVQLSLRYKEGWTDAQRAAADSKVGELNEAAERRQLPQAGLHTFGLLPSHRADRSRRGDSEDRPRQPGGRTVVVDRGCTGPRRDPASCGDLGHAAGPESISCHSAAPRRSCVDRTTRCRPDSRSWC